MMMHVSLGDYWGSWMSEIIMLTMLLFFSTYFRERHFPQRIGELNPEVSNLNSRQIFQNVKVMHSKKEERI